jgi:ABC-type dipeptide/oligopeptide/nickel transport system permease subunit
VLLALLLPDPCDPKCPPKFKELARPLLRQAGGCNPGSTDEEFRKALLRFGADFANWVDTLLSRMIDVMYSFPDLLLIIIVSTSLKAAFRTDSGGLLGPLATLDTAFGGLLGMFVALALVSWLTVARLVRAQVLSLKEREFVDAARALGASGGRILLRHLLPNTIAIVVVTATFGIPRAIVVEAALSFVGLGVQPPLTSWGAMILSGANAARAGLLHLTRDASGPLRSSAYPLIQ